MQTITLIIYAAIVHNYMILSETSIEEFPQRRRQIIIKKYPRELYSPFAGPWRLFDQTKSILKSLFKLSGKPRRPRVRTKKRNRKIEAN